MQKLFYDGSCRLCRREIKGLVKKASAYWAAKRSHCSNGDCAV
ncbi:hypothetical protein [Rheinheimera nanhaiensis]|uniref:DUF393 domain-containing protein n=1 Tax=Rheinheimera nanhaiensis E407-8 TaxID=562729 RepID=I1DVI9_9GAMM|nr:hypothetical protein [Rheinheimera nanhaiensis]GAB58067.1 hypothetical protein RNAN_1038 [Rheinheimera nanhaiensis E407-8]